MTRHARRLLNVIVQQIRRGRFVPGNPRTYLGYKQIHDLLSLPVKGGTWGRSLQIIRLFETSSDLQAGITEYQGEIRGTTSEN